MLIKPTVTRSERQTQKQDNLRAKLAFQSTLVYRVPNGRGRHPAALKAMAPLGQKAARVERIRVATKLQKLVVKEMHDNTNTLLNQNKAVYDQVVATIRRPGASNRRW